MTAKDLWSFLWRLFGLYLIYEIGSAILGLFLAWMPFDQGSTIAQIVMFVLCLIVFIQDIKNRFFASAQKPQNTKKAVKTQSVHKKPDLPKSTPKPAARYFSQDLQTLSVQVRRMDQKLEQLDQQLSRQFSSSGLSLYKFRSTVDEANQLFEKNCISIKERIELFDDLGYEQLIKEHREYEREAIPYQKSFHYVKEKLAQNENLINQINALLIEVSQIDEQATSEQDALILDELDGLIEQTRLYSQS